MTPGGTRLAVLGSPIAHSLSPRLHQAAYATLGLPWNYDAIDVDQARLAEFVSSCGPEWRGFSATMPLKRDLIPLIDHSDPVVEATGSVNTVLFRPDGLAGFNTDVAGIVAALATGGVTEVSHLRLLGAGATAASVVVAAASMGLRSLTIVARSAERAAPVVELAARHGVEVRMSGFGEPDPHAADVTVSTLPGGAIADSVVASSEVGVGVLFDVAYDPWPSTLAASWSAAGGIVISGLEMLAAQALVQVRIFVSGDARHPLDDEAAVFAAMRDAVGLP